MSCTMQLQFAPGPAWDWSLIDWQPPELGPASACNYCGTDLGDSLDVLILFGNNGYTATLCRDCQKIHFGLGEE